MTRPIRELVISAMDKAGLRGTVYDYGDRWTIEMPRGASWTYDHLRVLSEELGTTNITIDWHEGWAGTEITPGDPDEVRLVLKWP